MSGAPKPPPVPSSQQDGGGNNPAHHHHHDEDEDENVTTSLAPSHITPDGHFVHLPPPGPRERRQYFERSIARYRLLQEDLHGSKAAAAPTDRRGSKDRGGDDDDEGATEGEEGGAFDDVDEAASESGARRKNAADAGAAAKDDDAVMKVHPLALASAKIQAGGLNELNRAINLSGLVATGEYFGMANVVDPALVADQSSAASASAAATSASAAASKENPTGATAGPAAQGAAAGASDKGGRDARGGGGGVNDEDQRVRSLYVLKRKRSQFARAAHSLRAHGTRLRAGIVAQSRPDARLRGLRRHWRLVAPEHGTRALPHPARPTEVVAVDVDVYYNKSATSSSLAAAQAPSGRGDDQAFGRLTSRVPRYATLELMDEYKYETDLERWERRFQKAALRDGDGDAMDVEESEENNVVANDEQAKDDERTWTVAEPFAIADPTLGKVDVDFDSTKATTMLSLQFDIEKASTGFRQSALLRSMALSSNADATIHPDEKVLFTLQHSLFAAKLFESIRREIAPDTDEIGSIRPGGAATSRSSIGGHSHSSAWITQESEVNFLPPPTQMSGVGSGSGDGLVPLCVVHCHEGEVQVQLDCEYTLRVKLVEADGHRHDINVGKASNEVIGAIDSPASQGGGAGLSGSQSPEQLLLLCRTLLYHAEERYHEHSQRRALESQTTVAIANARDAHLRKREVPSPRILQSCVSLGSKLLMEERVRVALSGVQKWLLRRLPPNGDNGNQVNVEDVLHVTWLSLSVLDLHSQFTLSFRHWVADAVLVGEEITLTSTTPVVDAAALDHPDGNGGAAAVFSLEYRKVKFHSVEQLVLHLKLTLKRILMSMKS